MKFLPIPITSEDSTRLEPTVQFNCQCNFCRGLYAPLAGLIFMRSPPLTVCQ